MSAVIGFDFYGAGNVGDDLMLHGFLKQLGGVVEISGYLQSERLSSQRRRFPSVKWSSRADLDRRPAISQFGHWIGVGGTPFQGSSGPWLLNSIMADIKSAPDQRRWMIGIGCEMEVLKESQLATDIAASVEHIWTRDSSSRVILVDELDVDPKKVSLGGDLANIALGAIFPIGDEKREPGNKVAIVYYEDNRNRQNIHPVREFSREISKSHKLTFLANEVRTEGFEYSVYKALFGGWRSLLFGKPEFFAPDYENSNVPGLASHYSQYDVVMASRYHALLTAAWAGCRVVALDRSSKIRSLSAELGIPLVTSPFSRDKLLAGFAEAKAISRTLLQEKRLLAESSVSDFCRRLRNGN